MAASLVINVNADQSLEQAIRRLMLAGQRAAHQSAAVARNTGFCLRGAQLQPARGDVLVSSAGDFDENVGVDERPSLLLEPFEAVITAKVPHVLRGVGQNAGGLSMMPTTAFMTRLRASSPPRYLSRAAWSHEIRAVVFFSAGAQMQHAPEVVIEIEFEFRPHDVYYTSSPALENRASKF